MSSIGSGGSVGGDSSVASSTDDGGGASRNASLSTATANAANRPPEEPLTDPSTSEVAHQEERTISGKPYPAQPSIVQFVQVPRTFCNHTYRDFTNMPVEDDDYSFPTIEEQMNFHEKLYHLLTYTVEQHRHVMDWCCYGRAFAIKDADALEHLGFLRRYFGYAGIQRFRKQLHNNGYRVLLTQLQVPDCYYSEFLLQGMPHLLQYSPPFKVRRRLLPDPVNEPNFGDIASLFPLPGDRRALMMEARFRLQARGYFISDGVFESVVRGTDLP